MRILANENISSTVIDTLRSLGHDVLSVKEILRAAADDIVLAKARAEERLVITQDKDFGELAFCAGLPASSGIVLFRLSGSTPGVDNRRIVDVLSGNLEFQSHFCVVTDEKIRLRPLPSK